METCLKNLQTQVSFFGLTHRFDEFLILNRLLLGVSEIFYDATQNVTKKLYKTTKTTPTNLTINDQMLKQAKDLIQDEIWFFEQAQLIYDTRASSNNNFDVLVKQYNNTKTAMKENLKSFEHYVAQSHDWTKFYR